MYKEESGPVSVLRDRANRLPALATALLFVANGAIFGAIVPRLPDLKDALDLGPAAFGLAMACYPAGALIGGLFAPLIMRRRSDGAVAVTLMLAAALVAAVLGLAPTAWVFAALLAAFGVSDAITDVAMNAHGIRVQVRHGASLINRFHALWSLGAVLGALGGSAAAGAGAAVVGQMVVAAAICAALALAALPLLLGAGVAEAPDGSDLDRAPDGSDLDRALAASSADPAPRMRPRLPGGRALLLLLALGLIACCAALVEDYAQTWSAVYLRDVAVAGAGLAGLGFIAVQCSQLIGRLAGDSLVDGFGAAHVGRMGGLCVVTGSSVVLLCSFLVDGPALLPLLLVGFALTGWGIATIIPGAMVAADTVPDLPPGAGLAVLNWVIRLGFLASPPLVGLIAEYAGIRWTVLPMLVGGVLITLLSGPLLGRQSRKEVAA